MTKALTVYYCDDEDGEDEESEQMKTLHTKMAELLSKNLTTRVTRGGNSRSGWFSQEIKDLFFDLQREYTLKSQRKLVEYLKSEIPAIFPSYASPPAKTQNS